jgi:hypothetical protein
MRFEDSRNTKVVESMKNVAYFINGRKWPFSYIECPHIQSMYAAMDHDPLYKILTLKIDGPIGVGHNYFA